MGCSLLYYMLASALGFCSRQHGPPPCRSGSLAGAPRPGAFRPPPAAAATALQRQGAAVLALGGAPADAVALLAGRRAGNEGRGAVGRGPVDG